MIQNHVHTISLDQFTHNWFYAFGQLLMMRKSTTIYHYFSAQLLSDYNTLVNKIDFISKILAVFCNLYFAEHFILHVPYEIIYVTNFHFLM